MRRRFFAGLAFFAIVGAVAIVLLTLPEGNPVVTAMGLISGG